MNQIVVQSKMIARLDFYLEKILPEILQKPEAWDSLIVNKRKPYTYRVFTYLPDGFRICLHKFDPCHTHEAFKHPHPWAGAFMILEGKYQMWLGTSPDLENQPKDVATFELTKYSKYEIVEPTTWHSVIPLETTYTVMLNSAPWEAHKAAPTTKGKDLDKMPPDELLEHLAKFRTLVEDYNNSNLQSLLNVVL